MTPLAVLALVLLAAGFSQGASGSDNWKKTYPDSGGKRKSSIDISKAKEKKQFQRESFDLEAPPAYFTFSNNDTLDWSYRDIDAWKELYPDCGGDMQSPIDLDGSTEVTGTLGFVYSGGYNRTDQPLKLTNNGRTAVLTVPGGDPPSIRFENGAYAYLTNITFHWGDYYYVGSEHDLFSMEMQAVHEKVDANGKPLNPPETVVLATLLQATDNTHGLQYKFIEQLAEIAEPGTSVDVDPFPLVTLVSVNEDFFYRYEGSLTTPPCTERATYFISGEVKLIANYEKRYFQRMFGYDRKRLVGNRRPLQALNGRKVELVSSSSR